ncbi:MAG TPA: hypothetical protein ENN75_01040 [candidate division Zixibacteria bacterium]|nr:hypothetical protein [candidate division Zixibacteria bacterium]
MESDIIDSGSKRDYDLLFQNLRDKSLRVRMASFDTFTSDILRGELKAKGPISDFLSVVRVERIRGLAYDNDPESHGALNHVLKRICKLCRKAPDGGNFVPFIKTCLDLTGMPYYNVKASSIEALGKLYLVNPDELDDASANKLLRFFDSEASEIRSATASAWSDIAISNPEKAVNAISPAYRLLQDDDPNVRAESAGFFHSLADEECGECTVALPLLRKLKDNDPDVLVRERAGAAVLAIDNSFGSLF